MFCFQSINLSSQYAPIRVRGYEASIFSQTTALVFQCATIIGGWASLTGKALSADAFEDNATVHFFVIVNKNLQNLHLQQYVASIYEWVCLHIVNMVYPLRLFLNSVLSAYVIYLNSNMKDIFLH